MPHSATDKARLRIFLDAYIKCALWSTPNTQFLEDGEEEEETCALDEDYGPYDLSPEVYREMREDCTDFLFAHPQDPVTVFLSGLGEVSLWEAGCDFWLTRNGHGAGFWDGDWDKPSFEEDWGERLTERARPYGSVDLYVGDDKRIHSAGSGASGSTVINLS